MYWKSETDLHGRLKVEFVKKNIICIAINIFCRLHAQLFVFNKSTRVLWWHTQRYTCRERDDLIERKINLVDICPPGTGKAHVPPPVLITHHHSPVNYNLNSHHHEQFELDWVQLSHGPSNLFFRAGKFFTKVKVSNLDPFIFRLHFCLLSDHI